VETQQAVEMQRAEATLEAVEKRAALLEMVEVKG